ncbi:MAG: DUF962 domain-containing protein [Saprospirales bacterium]|jgi:hypothetical protein|nr:DUF962 domain-containing protein [Saprospirales bacterium]
MERKYHTLKDFYPYYLTEHSDPTCRLFHYIGTTLLFVIVIASIVTGIAKILFLLPIVGYGFAWMGHFIFEKNKPATFQYPFYSLASDFIMFFHFLTGKVDAKLADAKKIVGV